MDGTEAQRPLNPLASPLSGFGKDRRAVCVLDDPSRYAGNNGVRWYIINDNGVCANYSVISDLYWPKNNRTYTDSDIATDDGNLLVAAASTDGDAVANHAILANDDAPVNNDAQSRIIEISVPSDRRCVRNRCRKKESHEVVNQSRQYRHIPVIQNIREFIKLIDLAFHQTAPRKKSCRHRTALQLCTSEDKFVASQTARLKEVQEKSMISIELEYLLGLRCFVRVTTDPVYEVMPD